MTLDEKLSTIPAPVANAIQDIIDLAGTSDACWDVLHEAGLLVDRERKRADEMRRLRDEMWSDTPKWMARPNQPGTWACIGKNWADGKLSDSVLYLSQDDLDRGAPFQTVRVYGPIPDYQPKKDAE